MSPRTSAQFENIREKRRRKIFDTALELFALHGFDSTSISQIATRAGISKGLIYNYFESKEALLQELLADAMSNGEEMMAEMMAYSTPQEKMKYIIEKSFWWIVEREEYSKMMMSLSMQVGKFSFIQQMVDDKLSGYIHLFYGLLSDLGFENPEMEAKLLGAQLDGIGLQYVTIGNKLGVLQLKDVLIDKYCKKKTI